MTELEQVFTLFLSLFVEAIPFLTLGIVISSCLLVFIDEHKLVARLPRNPILGALIGSGLGMLLPVCQYGNVPVARRLLLQGVPLPLAISFLIAAPTINPVVLWVTWKTFPDKPEILLYRVLFAWVIAMVIACIFIAYRDKPSPLSIAEKTTLQSRSTVLKSGTFLLSQTDSQPLHRVGNLNYEYQTATTNNISLKRQLSLFLENTVWELLELGSILLVGCMIAAIIQVLLPPSLILSWGQTPATKILVMLLLGTILSLGSLADVAYVSYFTATFLNGALLAFVLFSSILDLKGLGLILSTFRPKIVLYLIILTAALTFLLSLLVDYYVS